MQCTSMNRRIGDALVETSRLAKTRNGYRPAPPNLGRSAPDSDNQERTFRFFGRSRPTHAVPMRPRERRLTSKPSFASQGAGRFRTMPDQHCLAKLDTGFSPTVTDVTDARKKSLSFNVFQAFQQLRDDGGPGIYLERRLTL